MRDLLAFALRDLIRIYHAQPVGCSGGKGDGADDTNNIDVTPVEDTEAAAPVFEDFIYVTDAAEGDTSCFDGSSWIGDAAAQACVVSATITGGTVEDFSGGPNVGGAEVSMYLSNDLTSTADWTLTTESDGSYDGTFQACQAFAVKVTTSDGSTVPTYQTNQIWGYTTDASPDFTSVATSTYETIPALLGVNMDEDKGVIAGGARDCNDDEIVNAQVIVRDADGNIPPKLTLRYTVSGAPSRVATATSSDGIWIALNVPEGLWYADMYISDGAGGQTLIGTTPVRAYPASVSITTVVAGQQDGIQIPDSCVTCEG